MIFDVFVIIYKIFKKSRFKLVKFSNFETLSPSFNAPPSLIPFSLIDSILNIVYHFNIAKKKFYLKRNQIIIFFTLNFVLKIIENLIFKKL
jgi:hypothetical protein